MVSTKKKTMLDKEAGENRAWDENGNASVAPPLSPKNKRMQKSGRARKRRNSIRPYQTAGVVRDILSISHNKGTTNREELVDELARRKDAQTRTTERRKTRSKKKMAN